MKKGKYWFSKLSHREKSKFKKNFIDQRGKGWFYHFLENDVKNKHDFIFCSFFLLDTPEGVKYWDNIASRKYY